MAGRMTIAEAQGSLTVKHSRLVARLKRQVDKASKRGLNRKLQDRLLNTVLELMFIERLMALSELEYAAVVRDEERLFEIVGVPTREEIYQRVMLMAPGAGLELP